MNKVVNNLVNYFAERRKSLFLIDSLGAILTAALLYGIMRPFSEYFGMPKLVISYLSFIAFCFSIYSIACFLLLKRHWSQFLKLIGVANLLYCALTIGLLIKHFALLTIIGVTYFLIEIVIVAVLGYLELKVAAVVKAD